LKRCSSNPAPGKRGCVGGNLHISFGAEQNAHVDRQSRTPNSSPCSSHQHDHLSVFAASISHAHSPRTSRAESPSRQISHPASAFRFSRPTSGCTSLTAYNPPLVADQRDRRNNPWVTHYAFFAPKNTTNVSYEISLSGALKLHPRRKGHRRVPDAARTYANTIALCGRPERRITPPRR